MRTELRSRVLASLARRKLLAIYDAFTTLKGIESCAVDSADSSIPGIKLVSRKTSKLKAPGGGPIASPRRIWAPTEVTDIRSFLAFEDLIPLNKTYRFRARGCLALGKAGDVAYVAPPMKLELVEKGMTPQHMLTTLKVK